MNSHTDLQQNNLDSTMNDNDRIGTDMNDTLHNWDVSSVIGLQKTHNLPQANKSSKVNGVNISVDNGHFNGDYCYMNSSTGYIINNKNYIDYTNKRYEISTNRNLRGNNGLADGVDIDDMLPESAPNQYVNMRYNDEHHNLYMNNKISTSNNSSVSTLTSPSVTSKNDEGCSLFSPIHKKIKYSDSSKTKSRAIRSANDVMKSQIKLFSNKTWNSIILKYLLKYKYTKEAS